MKYFTTILTILGLYLFVYACSEKPCTDDGCPDFHEIEVPLPDENIRGDLREIEKDWKQAVVVPYKEIELKYAVHKVVEKEIQHKETLSNVQYHFKIRNSIFL